MSRITELRHADVLLALYERARTEPASVSDTEILETIGKTYWITNASTAVSQVFSIIAPACLLRPHLTQQLIRAPIEAIIACGSEDPRSVVEAGRYLLAERQPYVAPDDYGRHWLEYVLPTLEPLIDEVFPVVLRQCHE